MNVNGYLNGLTALHELAKTHGVALELRLDPDLPPVLIKPGDLEQIVLNLAQNACEAMNDMPNKQLLITTEYLTIPASTNQNSQADAPCPCLPPGRYMKLTVTDTGRGLEPDLISRIFEPFFTTKPMGQTTGLGLATVYGIVYSNKGLIDVKSEPGKGSTFTIYWTLKHD
jgi:hypothetical protein